MNGIEVKMEARPAESNGGGGDTGGDASVSTQSVYESYVTKVNENRTKNQEQLRAFIGARPPRIRTRNDRSVHVASSRQSSAKDGTASELQSRDDMSVTSSILESIRLNASINQELVQNFMGVRSSRRHASVRSGAPSSVHRNLSKERNTTLMQANGSGECLLGKLPASLACIVCIAGVHPTESRDRLVGTHAQVETREDNESKQERDQINSNKKVAFISDLVDFQEMGITVEPPPERVGSDYREKRAELLKKMKKIDENNKVVKESIDSLDGIYTPKGKGINELEGRDMNEPEGRDMNGPETTKPPALSVERYNDKAGAIVGKNHTWNANALHLLNCLDIDIDDDHLWFDVSFEAPENFSYDDDSLSY